MKIITNRHGLIGLQLEDYFYYVASDRWYIALMNGASIHVPLNLLPFTPPKLFMILYSKYND